MPLTRATSRAAATIGAAGAAVLLASSFAAASYSGMSDAGVIKACWKNSGSANVRIVDHFPCKPGETPISWNNKGAKGDPGPAGANGKDGVNGVAGVAGKDGVSVIGPSGTPGASAYDIAKAAGFTGTEAEWLDSLKATGGGALSNVSDLDGLACTHHVLIRALGDGGEYEDVPGVLSTAVDEHNAVQLTCAIPAKYLSDPKNCGKAGNDITDDALPESVAAVRCQDGRAWIDTCQEGLEPVTGIPADGCAPPESDIPECENGSHYDADANDCVADTPSDSGTAGGTCVASTSAGLPDLLWDGTNNVNNVSKLDSSDGTCSGSATNTLSLLHEAYYEGALQDCNVTPLQYSGGSYGNDWYMCLDS